MIIVITILISTTLGLLLFSLLGSSSESDPAVAQRMERFILKPEYTEAKPAHEEEAPAKTPLTDLVKSLAKVLEGKGWGKAIDASLEQAEIPLKGSEFILLSTGLALVLAWLFWVIGRSELVAVGLALGYLLPKMVVGQKIKKRSAKLSGQIADTITLISNSLKAGYSFLQSMEMVSREMPPPISKEFARAVKEISLGADMEATLQAMSQRANSDDLDMMLTAVQIQRQVGGNLSEILDTIAQTIRERIRIKGEIKTLTAQGRVSGMIVAMLPFGLGIILYIMNPAYMSDLFTSEVGRAMLGVGLVSQIIGILLIKKIVNIEV